MSDNTDSSKSTDDTVIEGQAVATAAAVDTEKKTKTDTSSPQARKPSRWPALLLFLLILIVAAGVAYTYTEVLKLQRSNTQVETFSEERVDTLLADMQELRIEFARLKEDQDRSEQDAALQDMGLRLTQLGGRVSEITNVSRQSWLLAESEYLLRLANQRLLLEGEAASALALLQSADQILRDIDDVGLYPVRGALAKEVLALQSLGDFDRDGLVLKLAALAESLESLELLQQEKHIADEQREAAAAQREATSGEDFWASISDVSRYFRVYRRDQPVEPLLSPEQHYYVQQNLRLMMEQAQLAALQRNPVVYQQALAKAQNWVGRYFERNPASSNLLTQLDALTQIDVAPPIPDISTSLNALKAYLVRPTNAPASAAEGDAP